MFRKTHKNDFLNLTEWDKLTLLKGGCMTVMNIDLINYSKLSILMHFESLKKKPYQI